MLPPLDYTGFFEADSVEAYGFQNDEQLYQDIEWISGLGTNYHIGIDGISLWLVLLTTFLTAVCILAAWNSVEKGLGGFMMSRSLHWKLECWAFSAP